MHQSIPPREHDLGGFTVRRLLPHAQCRSVGPFVFFDHIGPAELGATTAVDVRPHPHIGLATVTYLWEGAMVHRDSLGNTLEIQPGDVNWMTAGSGIVHSERTPDRLRGVAHPFHGLQTWVALPRALEDAAPAFTHVPGARLPRFEIGMASVIVAAGHAFGREAPTPTHSDTLYAAVELPAGASLSVPADHEERAVYAVEGDVDVDGVAVPEANMAVVTTPGPFVVHARTAAKLMLVGGARLDGERFIWWNFVASSRERIEAAKATWQAQQFGQVPGETEFIPLPDR